MNLESLVRSAKQASRALGTASTDKKNDALQRIAEAIESNLDAILQANACDMEKGAEAGLSPALLDRLMLDQGRIEGLAASARQVAGLEDPVGTEIDSRTMYNGIELQRRRTPLGVVLAIYEARPNVTVDVACLCIKSGNAVVLRGGKESLASNRALASAVREGLEAAGLPGDAVVFVDDTDRAHVGALLAMDRLIDMVIPRGGAGLHRRCREQSRIPVMTGGIGICHMYVDATADLDRAVAIVENAKVQRPSVCNALDTLLVHSDVATDFLPRVAAQLATHGVELRPEDRALGILADGDHGATVTPAGPDDFEQEWLSLVLGVRVVDGLDQAIDHIGEHSSGHTESILTADDAAAERFTREVDSAAVFVNASTRFTDGGEFGLGAEVAISTQKLHARGPMGLQELTTYKWIGIGDGQIR